MSLLDELVAKDTLEFPLNLWGDCLKLSFVWGVVSRVFGFFKKLLHLGDFFLSGEVLIVLVKIFKIRYINYTRLINRDLNLQN